MCSTYFSVFIATNGVEIGMTVITRRLCHFLFNDCNI